MKKYNYLLLIMAEGGDVVHEIELSAETAIDILLASERVEISGAPMQVSRPVVPANENETTTKKRKQVTCSRCGVKGHNAKTCSDGREVVKTLAVPEATFSEGQYDAIRTAMHSHDFQSARYALAKKLPPREVNAAVQSSSYDNYLELSKSLR